jgi:hypothetical protein
MLTTWLSGRIKRVGAVKTGVLDWYAGELFTVFLIVLDEDKGGYVES